MARLKGRSVMRFFVALLIVLALALIAFFVGYLIGNDLAGAALPAFGSGG